MGLGCAADWQPASVTEWHERAGAGVAPPALTWPSAEKIATIAPIAHTVTITGRMAAIRDGLRNRPGLGRWPGRGLRLAKRPEVERPSR